MKIQNPYKILGLSPSATDAELKKRYYSLAMKYHPDKNQGNKAAEEQLKLVNAAYDQIQKERKANKSATSSLHDKMGATNSIWLSDIEELLKSDLFNKHDDLSKLKGLYNDKAAIKDRHFKHLAITASIMCVSFISWGVSGGLALVTKNDTLIDTIASYTALTTFITMIGSIYLSAKNAGRAFSSTKDAFKVEKDIRTKIQKYTYG